MIISRDRAARIVSTLITFTLVLLFSPTLFSQQTKANPSPAGVPEDWTHHHVVFSDPGTLSQAAVQGKLDQWLRITNDPRFKFQQARRAMMQKGAPAAAPEFASLAARISQQTSLAERIGERGMGPSPLRHIRNEGAWSMISGGFESQTGTVSGTVSTAAGQTIVITNGATSLTLTATPSAASGTGTFSGNTATAGQVATITNGSDIIYLALAGVGTLTVVAVPSTSDTLTVGGTTYSFATACGAGTTCINLPGGISVANSAKNIEAAIAHTTSDCGTTVPCYGSGITGANGNVTVSLTGDVLTLTNSTAGSIVFRTTEPSGDIALSPNGAVITKPSANTCTVDGSLSSTYTAGFQSNSSTTTLAVNLTAAINACPSADSGLATIATPTTATLTLNASASGTGGNSIALVNALGGLTWSGSNLTGGLAATQSGLDFETNSTASTEATNIADAINLSGNGSSVGVSAVANSPSDGDITVMATTAGTQSITLSEAVGNFDWTADSLTGGATPTYTPDIFPAKYSFDATSSAGNCDSSTTPDYVVYPTGLTGSVTQSNIIAYDNIYSTCSVSSVPFPNVYWQFNTGGTVTTSPVLSFNGDQVAFVQTNSSNEAQLVLLKWNKDSALQSPTVEATAADYASCIAPCYFAMTLAATKGDDGADPATNPSDTYSSPFYDYTDDAIYVGEDNGYLHKFSPVFNGTPVEISSGFPAIISVANLNSPVYDYNSGKIFVGPAIAVNGSSAYMHSIASTGASETANGDSLSAIANNDLIFVDGFLVDSTAEMVYAFVNDDGKSPNAAVWQLPADFTDPTAGVEAKVGNAGPTSAMYSGTFDNIYVTNNPGTTAGGNLYVCGRAASSQDPELWKVNISNTTLAVTAIDTLTTATAQCSPVTEFYNGTTDYIFLSVEGSSQTAAPASCPSSSSGCLMAFVVTTPPTGTLDSAHAVSVAGGTSGLIIDNQSTTPGNSQIYFFPLAATSCAGNSNATAGVGTGHCASQLSQSGLN